MAAASNLAGWSSVKIILGFGFNLLPCKRPTGLSITHKFTAKSVAEGEVGEAGQTAPHDDVAWHWITGACQVAAKPGNPDQICVSPRREARVRGVPSAVTAHNIKILMMSCHKGSKKHVEAERVAVFCPLCPTHVEYRPGISETSRQR